MSYSSLDVYEEYLKTLSPSALQNTLKDWNTHVESLEKGLPLHEAELARLEASGGAGGADYASKKSLFEIYKQNLEIYRAWRDTAQKVVTYAQPFEAAGAKTGNGA
jgi:hypothetical protein